MNFSAIPAAGTVRAFTPEEQAAAWEALIAQDPYLSKHRGEYAERGAVFLPLVHRLDFSITQDVFANIGGERHRFQFRIDIDQLRQPAEQELGRRRSAWCRTQPLTNPAADARAAPPTGCA